MTRLRAVVARVRPGWPARMSTGPSSRDNGTFWPATIASIAPATPSWGDRRMPRASAISSGTQHHRFKPCRFA